MFTPLKDENSLKIIPYQFVTVSLIAVFALIFLWPLTLSDEESRRLLLSYAINPAAVFGNANLPDFATIPAELTILTSLFLHIGWLHILSNLLYLWVFGDNVENSMGHVMYLGSFLVCGIAGGILHAAINSDYIIPTVGASGAVSGVLGAYLMLHPRVRVLALVFHFYPVHLPAYIVLCGWIVLQVIMAAFDATPGGVAWWAHIGGFATGAILITFLKYPHIRLFDRPTVPPAP
jgi:membrane associated rhomboid family serine protease